LAYYPQTDFSPLRYYIPLILLHIDS